MNTAPIELLQIGLDQPNFMRSDRKSWRGPCPDCGGSRRFVIFTDNPWPSWYGMCDLCGLAGWANQLNTSIKTEIDPFDAAVAKIEYQQAQLKRAEKRKSQLSRFTTNELWVELHQRMSEINRTWWRNNGIPNTWQDFWKLGYVPERTFEHNGEKFTRAAYSIPKFDLGWQPTNMDYRIVDPPEGVGKYRPVAGIPSSVFLSRPDLDGLHPNGRAIIVEGSKKAAVTCLYLESTPQVIGVPSCNNWAGIEERLGDADRVFIILDPDAQAWAWRKAKEIGETARVVQMGSKVDDAFIYYGLDENKFWSILDQGRKL